MKDVSRSISAFLRLQGERHSADYNNSIDWNPRDAQELVAVAEAAFENWHAIERTPAANEYLLSHLVGKKRD